ncbi:4353_t:CDS:2 [Entrophospora sp. SA101]|nr:4353_t:CDS:2 [Entrophospora sp. SA101]
MKGTEICLPKAAVKRIGPSQNLPKRIGDDLLSAVSKGRDLSSVFSSFFDNAINKNNQLEDNLNLEGSLSFKGFINLEELDISNQKITALDIADCSQLRDLNCSNNQLTNLDLANNQQIEQINFSSNQLTNLNLKGLTKIEKIFCSGNKLANLEFLKDIDPTKVLTLRMDNNNFPAQDLSCFTPFTKLQRLFITNNPFYGSLKPLRNLTEIKEIGITGTNVNSGLENLHEDFFKVNAVNNAASSLGLTGGYFKRIIQCSEKLAEQLKDYEEKNIESQEAKTLQAQPTIKELKVESTNDQRKTPKDNSTQEELMKLLIRERLKAESIEKIAFFET